MKPWAIYTRVSTDEQADEGASLDAQMASCKAYATARGWPIGEELTDDGYTGKNTKRPGYQRLVVLLRERAIAGVIAWKLKRLSRKARDIHDLLDLLKETGCEFATVSESWDTTTPMGRAMVGVGAIFAQLESDDNGVQTAAAMRYLSTQGYWTGGTIPAGCVVVLTPDGKRRRLERGPGAEVVAQAWGWVTTGDSLRQVGDRLTAGGVSPPRHKDARQQGWTPSAVRSLLLSAKVTGLLVDAPTQALVRSILSKRSSPVRRGRDREIGTRAAQPSPLAGILRCPSCSASCVQVTAKGNGGLYRYFRCCSRVKGLCGQKDLRCEPIEDAVVEAVAEAAQPGGDYHRKVRGLLEMARATLDAGRTERARLTAERDQLAARVGELTLRTQIGTTVWDAAMKSLGVELERVDRRLAELAGTIAAGEVDHGSLDLVLGEISRGAALLAKGTNEERVRILRTLVAAARIEGELVLLDLYEPQLADGAAGSSIGRRWLPGKHGIRTVRVAVLARNRPLARRKRQPAGLEPQASPPYPTP